MLLQHIDNIESHVMSIYGPPTIPVLLFENFFLKFIGFTSSPIDHVIKIWPDEYIVMMSTGQGWSQNIVVDLWALEVRVFYTK